MAKYEHQILVKKWSQFYTVTGLLHVTILTYWQTLKMMPDAPTNAMLRQMRVGKARYVKQCKPAIHKIFSLLIGPNDVAMLHEFPLFGGASVIISNAAW